MTTSTTPSPSQRIPAPPASLALFLVLLTLFSAVTAWVLVNGYVSATGLHRWSKVIANLDTQGFRIENLGLLYPHVPVYGLAALRFLPEPYGAVMPYFLGVLVLALLLTLWSSHLRRKGYDRRARWWLVALVACNPLLLWAASSGMHNALLLAGFYVVCYGCYLVVSIHDVRTLVYVAFALSLLFFLDERAAFILVGLLPLVPFFASPRMVRDSVLSVYAVLVFPVLVSAFAWVYLNWVFHGDPWFFVKQPESAFLGFRASIGASPWLAANGGVFTKPTLLAAALALVCFPLPFYLAMHGLRHERNARATLVLYGHLAVAIGLGSTLFFLRSPIDLLYLLNAVTMAALLLMPVQRKRFATVVAVLLLGNAASAIYLVSEKTPDVKAWRDGLTAAAQAPRFEADRRFGLWLRDSPMPTLMDDRPTFAAIVARGHGRELVLPHSDRFKQEVKRRAPTVEQVVVFAPETPAAAQDRVGQRFVDLYWNGTPGYALVYDVYPIRVYRRAGA